MTSRQKKGTKSSVDDILEGLLGDDDDYPVEVKTPSRQPARQDAPLPSRSGKRSLLDEDFFSKLAEEVADDGDEGSDVSEADPMALLESMKDMDDMDADLFPPRKKPGSAPAQSTGSAGGARKDALKAAGEAGLEERKPSSAPASGVRGYKKFNFTDEDDDDGGSEDGQTPDTKDLDDPLTERLAEQSTKKLAPAPGPGKPLLSPSSSPVIKKKESTAPGTQGPKKRDELTFDDDKDDLMDALGFGDSPMDSPKKKETVHIPKKDSGDPPQRARTRLDEILGRGTSPRLLERPPTGERKEQQPQQQQKTSNTKDPFLEDDLTFGSYQPTLGATPEGRHSRRQSVRFSTEDVSATAPETKPKLSTPSASRNRAGADWLGLKMDDDDDDDGGGEEEKVKEPKSPSEIPFSSSSVERKPPLKAKPVSETPVQTSSTPTASATPASAQPPQAQTVATSRGTKEMEDEDDWLSGALSRRKTQAAGARPGGQRSRQEEVPGSGEELDLQSVLSKPGSSPASRRRKEAEPSPPLHSAHAREDPSRPDTIQPSLFSQPPPSPHPSSHPLPHSSHPSSFSPQCSPTIVRHASTPPHPDSPLISTLPTTSTVRASLPQPRPRPQPRPQPQSQPHQYSPLQDPSAPGGAGHAELPPSCPNQPWQPLSSPGPGSLPTMLPGSMWPPQPGLIQTSLPSMHPAQPQVSLSADSLQLLLQQQLVQSQLLGLGGAVGVGGLQRQQQKEGEQQLDFQTLQARIIHLEGQVRTLQLERDQTQMLLESVQQRHKQDTELMENTHRARVKLLEESACQRELRARQESEDLAERLATLTRLGEQERSELQARHQRRLDQAQQDRDREVERLRDLQRKSILEMKKDHEEQVQRLKRLKEEEIDAVTSATSQTRSLTVVIEQMEQFSHRLGDLSSRVESTHEHTTQGLEQSTRQRDEQLRVMQERLGQQQRVLVEERSRLQEVIAKMDTQLAEQQRQLEKERWRATAEQAKAESLQRGVEEERRSLTQHIAMEREELERAKTALLEEQQEVMRSCAEERRKLAAERSQFYAQDKERQSRAEREASRALERHTHREDSIISMAQEQADLKLRAGELRQREESVAREREELQRQREELAREKEGLSSMALGLKTRVQEVETLSKLASERYEEGERALLEARQVELEHQARLRTVHTRAEQLRTQEKHLHQERARMTEQRREMERLRQGLPVPPLPHTLPPVFTTDFSPVPAPPPLLTSTLTFEPSPAPAPPSPGATELQARLALLRHTAEKDRDFLQEEQFFLDALKKAPYNSAFHTH